MTGMTTRLSERLDTTTDRAITRTPYLVIFICFTIAIVSLVFAAGSLIAALSESYKTAWQCAVLSWAACDATQYMQGRLDVHPTTRERL